MQGAGAVILNALSQKPINSHTDLSVFPSPELLCIFVDIKPFVSR